MAFFLHRFLREGEEMKRQKLFSLFSKKRSNRPSITEKNENQRIEEIFKELTNIKLKRKRLTRYVKGMEQRKKDLEKYESLTEEDHGKVAGFLDQYKGVIEQRKLLEGRLIRNNPSLRIIQAREKEIPTLITEMREIEKNQRYAHNDMLYLEEEKDDLYDYRESLITSYRALKIIAISLIIVLGIVSIILLTMVQTLRESIFVPTSVITIMTLIFSFGILVIKRKIEYELGLNERMQRKASRLMNTTKIRYFHHTNYLNFQYRKLVTKNADQLQGQYERYQKNKNNEAYYNSMNNQLVEIENKVFDVLYEKGIERDAFDNIDEWAEVQNISILVKNINEEYENTSKQIKALDAYEEELTKEAFVMTETNPEIGPKVEELMEEYMNSNGGNK